MPNYFGKRGFKTPQSIKGTNKPTTINIGQLDQLIDKLNPQTPKTTTTAKKTTKPKAISINLTELGIQKLLATGHTSKPLTIKVQTYSQTALKKIEEAGGKIISPQQQPEETKIQQLEETQKEPTKT
jgi:large subunit ribosomal protein L15